MYRTLLVPLDGSDFSARALVVAVDLARRTGATVHLALVNDPSSYIPFVPGEVAIPVYNADIVRERRDADQAALDRHVAELNTNGVRAVGVLLEGTVIESLLEYGQQVASELTIMTTHGRGGFARLRLGSVTTAYLSRATTPVLLVRGGGSDAPPTLPTGMLLCALDGSPFGERILAHASVFAAACEMTMELFSVNTPHAVSLAPFGTEALLADPVAIEEEERFRASYLTRLLEGCPSGSVSHEVTDMAVGQAILDEAARIDAGAIALVTHGRSGISRFVLGSVADELIRHAALPMLVYRPDDPK
jgi:nucleotide-binding universal stress UspA family protein